MNMFVKLSNCNERINENEKWSWWPLLERQAAAAAGRKTAGDTGGTIILVRLSRGLSESDGDDDRCSDFMQTAGMYDFLS